MSSTSSTTLYSSLIPFSPNLLLPCLLSLLFCSSRFLVAFPQTLQLSLKGSKRVLSTLLPKPGAKCIPSRKTGGRKTTYFRRLCNLTANLMVNILGMKHVIDNLGTALQTAKVFYSASKFHEQTAQNSLRKFCILLHCQASHTEFGKRNSTKLNGRGNSCSQNSIKS